MKEARNVYNKKNDKDVFIHKMHIKMANMDKQETPPCLITLWGNGKCLTPIWQTNRRFQRKLFSLCRHVLSFNNRQLREADEDFPLSSITMICNHTHTLIYFFVNPLFSFLLVERTCFPFFLSSFPLKFKYAQTFIWLLQQN